MQTTWVLKGIKSKNKASVIVGDFFDRMLLAKLGYSFNPEELEPWEVEAFRLIQRTIDDHNEKEALKAAKKR
jgi:hypothetical protein